MICVPKSPRRLFYKWTTWGVEIEYPSDIPTPIPVITVNSVQVTLPPTVPGYFQFYVSQPYEPDRWPTPQPAINNYLLANFYSHQVPTFYTIPRWGGAYPHCHVRITTYNQWGQPYTWRGQAGVAYTCGSLWMIGGGTQAWRCDLLVGSDRIINPAVNTACPTWRLAGGICPPDTITCGDECMPCDSLVASIQALMV